MGMFISFVFFCFYSFSFFIPFPCNAFSFIDIEDDYENMVYLNLDSLNNRIRVCNMDAIVNIGFDKNLSIFVREHVLNEFKSVSYLDNTFYPNKMNSLSFKLMPNHSSFSLLCVENRYFNTKVSKYILTFDESLMVVESKVQ